MREVDWSIHPPVSQSKAIDEGDSNWAIGDEWGGGELTEKRGRTDWTKKRKGKSCLNVVGEVSLREQREVQIFRFSDHEFRDSQEIFA